MKSKCGAISIWLVTVMMCLLLILPIFIDFTYFNQGSYQLSRIEHILQESAAQVWLCQYFAFIVGDDFYLMVDEIEAEQLLLETIRLNFQQSGLDNARVARITFAEVNRYSQADLCFWHIPLITIEAVLTDHTETDISVIYEYEMATDPIKFKEGSEYQ